MNWISTELRNVLKLDVDRVELNPATTYDMVGVYSFGRGLFHREPVNGGATSYKFFYRLKADHLVMSQLFGWEGAIAFSSEEYEGKYVSPQFPTFLCDSKQLDRGFLSWLIRRPTFWNELGKKTKGMGDRRRTLNPESLLSNVISLPPLPEQRRIVARIEELAVKVEEARKLRDEGSQDTDKLLPSQVSIIFDNVLKDLPRAPISSLGVNGENPIQIGPFGAQLHKSEFSDFGVPVLNVGNVTNQGLNTTNLNYVTDEKAEALSRYTVAERDLLFARSGATLGKVCLVPPGCDGWLMTGHLFRVRFDRERILPEFALAALRWATTIRTQVFDQVRGATRPGFNTTLLGKVQLPLPSVSEQQRIVNYITGLAENVSNLKYLQTQTAAELDALMPAILDKAFRGEL